MKSIKLREIKIHSQKNTEYIFEDDMTSIAIDSIAPSVIFPDIDHIIENENYFYEDYYYSIERRGNLIKIKTIKSEIQIPLEIYSAIIRLIYNTVVRNLLGGFDPQAKQFAQGLTHFHQLCSKAQNGENSFSKKLVVGAAFLVFHTKDERASLMVF